MQLVVLPLAFGCCMPLPRGCFLHKHIAVGLRACVSPSALFHHPWQLSTKMHGHLLRRSTTEYTACPGIVCSTCKKSGHCTWYCATCVWKLCEDCLAEDDGRKVRDSLCTCGMQTCDWLRPAMLLLRWSSCTGALFGLLWCVLWADDVLDGLASCPAWRPRRCGCGTAVCWGDLVRRVLYQRPQRQRLPTSQHQWVVTT